MNKTLEMKLIRESAADALIIRNPVLNRQHVLNRIEQHQLNELLRPELLISYLTKRDLYSRIVARTIQELREHNLVEPDSVLLQEGFWDSIQAGIGNFAGGVDSFLKKIKIKKEPEGWEQAQRIFQKVANEEGNQLVKDLIKAIDEEANDLESGLGSGSKDRTFPVNKNRNVFFSGVNTLAAFYDSVVAATEKDSGENGFLPVPVANEVIEQLRIVVNKYISDTEREKGGMYASFGGGDAEEGGIKEENFDRLLGLLQEEAAETAEQLDADAEYEKIMRGQESPVFKRMTSMKAPLVIAGVGAALGALGWIAMQPWFHDLVLNILNISKTTDVTSTKKVTDTIQTTVSKSDPMNFGNLKPGEGVARATQRLMGGSGAGFDIVGKNATLDDLRAAALKVGGGDLNKGLEGMAGLVSGEAGGDPSAALEAMKGALSDPSSVGIGDPSAGGSLWKLWSGAQSGHGGTIFATSPGKKLQGFITKKIIKTISKEATKVVVKKGTSAAAASAVAMMTGAGAVLAGVGVSAVVAGGTLAYIRNRAKKKSRLGTLQDLLSKLDTIQPKPVKVEAPPEEDINVTITLEGFINSNSLMDLIFEDTRVEISGLSGDPDLEKTGGRAMMVLPAAGKDVALGADDIGDIPKIKKNIEKSFSGLDLGADNVNVTVVDNRKEKPEDPPPLEEPPVAVIPADIAKKGKHAVCIFGPEGAMVFRILKKKTYRAYAGDAKRSKDKDAPKFLDRYKNYDSILAKLRADGVLVNSDELEPRGVGDHTVIYLVDDELVAMIKDVEGVEPDQARKIVLNAIAKWSKSGKRPKVKELGVDDKVGDVLRKGSLAEVFNFRRKVAIVPVGPRFFEKVLRG